jgi:hypothetical protein
VVLSPLLLVTVGLFFANQGKPFLPIGKEDGVILKIIKFKTMNDKKDAQ